MTVITFKSEQAVKYGVMGSIVLNAIKGSIMFKDFPIKDTGDGIYIRLTPEDICKYVPFYSRNQVKRAIDRLLIDEAIEADNFNDHKFDRTRWFKIND